MKQLVQLRNDLGELLEKHNVSVLVIFREESEGQDGLKKVVEQTNTEFTLALDENARETSAYSPGEMVHDSYVISSDGVIRAILAGKRYDRAKTTEFSETLERMVTDP